MSKMRFSLLWHDWGTCIADAYFYEMEKHIFWTQKYTIVMSVNIIRPKAENGKGGGFSITFTV